MTVAPSSSSSTFEEVRSATCASIDASGVDRANVGGAAGSFRETTLNVGFFVQPLPLQIAGFEVVAVDQDQPAHSGARHRSRMKTSERAAAHDRYRGRQKFLLPAFAQTLETDLPRVTFPLVRSHTTRW